MEELLNRYNQKLERKKRIIVDYIGEKNSIHGFETSKREIEYNVLKAEIDLLEKIIEDLNYLNK